MSSRHGYRRNAPCLAHRSQRWRSRTSFGSNSCTSGCASAARPSPRAPSQSAVTSQPTQSSSHCRWQRRPIGPASKCLQAAYPPRTRALPTIRLAMPVRDAPAFGRHKAPTGPFVSGLSPRLRSTAGSRLSGARVCCCPSATASKLVQAQEPCGTKCGTQKEDSLSAERAGANNAAGREPQTTTERQPEPPESKRPNIFRCWA